MKHRVVLGAFLVLLTVGHPFETWAQGEETHDQACDQFGEIAQSIMRARQNNTPVSRLIARNNETFDGRTDNVSVEYAAVLRGLILAAYEIPRFGTARYQGIAIAEFRNEAELACFSDRLSDYSN